MSNSATSSETWKRKLTDHLMRMGKIRQWAGVVAMQDLEKAATEQQKNREAESSWVRRNLWGSQENTSQSQSSDDMQTTVLGDVTNPAPVVIAPQGKSGIGTLAAVLLGASIPAAAGGGALAAYMATRAPTQPTQFEDASTSIGLGKIEDYLRDNSDPAK